MINARSLDHWPHCAALHSVSNQRWIHFMLSDAQKYCALRQILRQRKLHFLLAHTV